MKRRPLCLLLLGILCWSACAPIEPARQTAPPIPSAPQPNLILIMADDLGYGDLGAYGQERIQTPNLDRLAAEGIRFTDFYAGSTVCAPSRAVFMTGRHTGHVSVRGNAGGTPAQALADDDVTVAEVLQAAGYTTGLIGKWGLGEPGLGHLPRDEGFDAFFGYYNQVHAHNYYPAYLWRNGEQVPLRNAVTPSERTYGGFRGGVATIRNDYSHDLMTEEALRFVARHRAEPFFLFLAYTIPHANNEAGDEGMEVPALGAYLERDWPAPQKGTAAMITRLDRDVGRLVAQLERLGLSDETVVLFTSDNGPHREGGNDPAFFDSNGVLRGIKRDLYEGGIRVPMIAWGAGIPAGRTSDHIGYAGDLMATAAELAGATPPDSIDSISLVPTLLGRPDAQREHDYLYWEFYEGGSAQAVRAGRWKAVRRPMLTGEIELYDLSEDIGETRDVSASHPEVVARMRAYMEEAHTPSPLWQAAR